MNAAQPFIEVFLNNLDKIAIVEPDGRNVDYNGLMKRVFGFAEMLSERGFKRGDRVLIQLPNGIEFAACALGVLFLGGVPLLLEPGLGDQVYLSRVKLAKPKWILVHPKLIWVNRLPGAARLLKRLELDIPPLPPVKNKEQKIVVDARLIDKLAKADIDPNKHTAVENKGTDDAIIVFTGGTTSLPKGVRISVNAFQDYIANIFSAIEGLEINNLLADTPPQVFYALRLGSAAYITKGRKQKRAAYVKRLIMRGSIDAYFGSPYVWMEIIEKMGSRQESPPATLKTVLLGSAPVTQDFLATLIEWLPKQTKIMIIYGMTEVGPISVLEAKHKLNYQGEGDLVGAPLDRVKVEIATEEPDSEIGEVVIYSPSLYSGYLSQPTRKPEEGLHTGDFAKMVSVEKISMIALMGRKKDMIIRNGVNIYPLSFESNIKKLTIDSQKRFLIRECAMIGLWNTNRHDEDVVLCVQPFKGTKLNMAQLKSQVSNICGTDAKPDHYLTVDKIPVSGRQNKVDKQALRKYCAKVLERDLNERIHNN